MPNVTKEEQDIGSLVWLDRERFAGVFEGPGRSVGLSITTDGLSAQTDMAPHAARELAARLIAMADRVQTVRLEIANDVQDVIR